MIVFIILTARVELNTDKYDWLSLKHVRMSLMGPCHHHKCWNLHQCSHGLVLPGCELLSFSQAVWRVKRWAARPQTHAELQPRTMWKQRDRVEIDGSIKGEEENSKAKWNVCFAWNNENKETGQREGGYMECLAGRGLKKKGMKRQFAPIFPPSSPTFGRTCSVLWTRLNLPKTHADALKLQQD